MSELTKYNKVWCWMEQCQYGDDLWVKADEAEQRIAYLENCVKTSAALVKIEADGVAKRNTRIAELQKDRDHDKDALETYQDLHFSELSRRIDAEDRLRDCLIFGAVVWMCAIGEALYIILG